MKIADLKFFSEALEAVFQEIGIFPVALHDNDLKGFNYELISTLGITGDIQGYLMIKSSIRSAWAFIDLMAEHAGMEIEEKTFGKFHKAAIGEITNQIAGRAVMLLSENGLDCHITPPTIITGNNVYTDIINLEMSLSRKVEGKFGDFGFFVGIKNAKKAY